MEHLYFYDNSCYWCTQISPIVDELNTNGYQIGKMDIGVDENNRLYELLKKKYTIECGTPLLINKNTGVSLCGAAPKETIIDWAKNELKTKQPNALAEKLNRIENKLDFIIRLISED